MTNCLFGVCCPLILSGIEDYDEKMEQLSKNGCKEQFGLEYALVKHWEREHNGKNYAIN